MLRRFAVLHTQDLHAQVMREKMATVVMGLQIANHPAAAMKIHQQHIATGLGGLIQSRGQGAPGQGQRQITLLAGQSGLVRAKQRTRIERDGAPFGNSQLLGRHLGHHGSGADRQIMADGIEGLAFAQALEMGVACDISVHINLYHRLGAFLGLGVVSIFSSLEALDVLAKILD
jgi:hypothetical protein